MAYYTVINSPLGNIVLTSDGKAITGLYTAEHRNHTQAHMGTRSADIFHAAIKQLEEYFDGVREIFDLPLAPVGSDFQKRVWNTLLMIPHGQTMRYGQIATLLGNPDASRAVGLANGKNPISIIVPCHRVIGASGKLTGYAGGLAAKQWLLEHECRHRAAA